MTDTSLDARAKALITRLLGSPVVFAIVAGLSIAILGAASLPWPDNRFSALLDTAALGIVVREDTTLRLGLTGAGSSGIGIEQAEVLTGTVPPLAPFTERAPFSGRLVGGTVELEVLRLGRGAELGLLIDAPGRLEIRLRGDATVDLVLGGVVRAMDAADRETEFRFNAPQVITLRQRTNAIPLRLLLAAPAATAPVTMDGLYITQMTLTRDRPLDSPGAPFRAEVKSGKIRLLDVHNDRDLRAGEQLRFERLDAYLAVAEIGAKAIRTDLVGHAHRIVLGPDGYADDITPSFFEYVVNQELLKLLWGAGAVFIGSLWSVRRWAQS